jgi:hypothetical protein
MAAAIASQSPSGRVAGANAEYSSSPAIVAAPLLPRPDRAGTSLATSTTRPGAGIPIRLRACRNATSMRFSPGTGPLVNRHSSVSGAAGRTSTIRSRT